MADNDAEEITIVLKDGTVYRYTGEAASDLWSGIRRAEGEYLDLSMSLPTTTNGKPLRRVVEVVGRHNANVGTVEVDGVNGYTVGWFLPEAVRGWFSSPDNEPDDADGPRCRFRFTVEAVPVEEKDR